MKYILLLGRVLFSSIFLVKSLCHFSGQAIEHAVSKGVPMAPLLVPLAGMIAFLGGLSVLLGYKARLGAWLLVLFLLPTAFIMHPFWGAEDFYSAMMEQYCFMKNMSLLGAALMIAYFGSGPLSLEKSS